MSRNVYPLLALALFVAVLCVVGYKLAPVLFRPADLALPAIPCNPSEEICAATLPGGGRLEFTLAPRPVRPLQAMSLTLRLHGVRSSTAEVDFAGVDMDMGFNRVRLAPAGEGEFAGQAMLPVCVSGRMTWAATVIVEQADGRIAVPFHFDVAGR